MLTWYVVLVMNARIHFNSHKKLLSVQMKIEGRWKVVSYVETAYLANVKFKVSEAGRQRVLKNKRKNAHAFICGDLISGLPNDYGKFNSARYNPYELEKFQCENKYIDRADFAILSGHKLFVSNPS